MSRCIRCLKETPLEVFLALDHLGQCCGYQDPPTYETAQRIAASLFVEQPENSAWD